MNRGHLSWVVYGSGELKAAWREKEKQIEVDAVGSGNKLMYTQQYGQILKNSFE